MGPTYNELENKLPLIEYRVRTERVTYLLFLLSLSLTLTLTLTHDLNFQSSTSYSHDP